MQRRRVAVLVLVLGFGLLAGCARAAQVAPELASAAGAVGRSVEVSGSSIDDLARATRTSPTIVEDVTRTGGSTQRWRQWPAQIRDANTRTQGPLRDAVVDAACESLRGEDAATTLSSELSRNGIDVSPARKLSLLADTFSLGQELRAASMSSDPQERAAVAVFCYTATVTG